MGDIMFMKIVLKNIIFVHSHFQPVFRPQAVEVRGIHHRAILSFHVSNQVWCCRNPHNPEGLRERSDIQMEM